MSNTEPCWEHTIPGKGELGKHIRAVRVEHMGGTYGGRAETAGLRKHKILPCADNRGLLLRKNNLANALRVSVPYQLITRPGQARKGSQVSLVVLAQPARTVTINLLDGMKRAGVRIYKSSG